MKTILARTLASWAVLLAATTNAAAAPSYQAMWWGGPSQDGWGVSLILHEDRYFGALLGYDISGQPTWAVAPSAFLLTGSDPGRFLVLGGLLTTHGSPFFAYDSSAFRVTNSANAFGLPSSNVVSDRMEFVFPNSGEGTFSFVLNGPPFVSASAAVIRQDFSDTSPSPMTGLADMWWGGDSQAGWGIAIHEQLGALFSVWLTYDESGNPTWFMLPPGAWIDSTTYAGPIIRTTGSSLGYGSVPYDPSKVQLQEVGSFRLNFSDTQHATFEYTAQGHSGSIALSREPF